MKDSGINADKLGAILDYWIEHNEGHHRENEKWLRSVEEYGNDDISRAIRKALELRRHYPTGTGCKGLSARTWCTGRSRAWAL